MSDEDSGFDNEYFKSLIEEKLENKGSYLESLAMSQMGGDFDPEGKLIFLCVNMV